jgi:steroid 5-alpha reductase family enzyme
MLASVAAVVAMMIALWVVSLLISDASIVDIFWGLGFVLVAWVSVAVMAAASTRGYLVAVLVTIWGVRLATYLAIRNVGRGEDYRYRAMRAHHGVRFPLVSLGTVFLLQGAIMWTVSLPVQVAVAAGDDLPLGWLDAAGLLLVAAGLCFEAVADAQLSRFKRRPESAGRVMDRGLWRYSRHPNYFGDCLVWWGFGLFGLAAGMWWTILGPAVMTVLLLKVSGVSLLESTIVERRPAYRDYMARTSAFVPWPPRRG